MGTFLTYGTLLLVLVVVLALVVYLVGIIVALRRANSHLYELADGLAAIVEDTEPLPDKLTTINDALSELLTRLTNVDRHLASVAKLLRR